MKKTIIQALVAAGLVAAAGVASADSGNISFQGNITQSACSISGNNLAMTVQMGSVATHEFSGIGSRNSVGTDFSISLLNCDTTVAQTASIAFKPGAGTVINNRLLSLENGGGAQGVAIALVDQAGKDVTVGGQALSYTLIDGTNQFNFKAFYEATEDTVTAGPANARAIFDVTYS